MEAEEIVEEVPEELEVEEPAEEVKPEESEPAEPQQEFSDEELKAITKVAEKIGYNPNYDGPNKKSPVDYIMDGRDIQKQLSDSLRDKMRHLDALKDDVGRIVEFNKKQSEKHILELEGKIQSLKAKREEAVAEGDIERFKETEKDLIDTANILNTEKATLQEKPKEKPSDETFQKAFTPWVERNGWFSKDEQMTRYAMSFKNDPRMANMNDEEYLSAVEKEVREAFPHKFQKPVPSTPTVSSGSTVRKGAVAPAKTYSEAGLSYQQKQLLDDYERMGIFKNKEERQAYVKDMLGRV